MKKTDEQKISDAYQKMATEQPPIELDNKILSAAHAEAPRKSNVIGFKLIPPGWIVPLTVAATIILSIGVVLTIPDSDFQKPTEYDYAIPGSFEEQRSKVVLENEVRKKAKLAQEQEPARQRKSDPVPSALEDTPAKDVRLEKYESSPKPAMSPQPEKSLAARSDAESGALKESIAESKVTGKSIMPESRAVLPRKSNVQLAGKQVVKKTGFIVFSDNLKKIKTGDTQSKVLDLLGTPFHKEKNSWQYQYIIDGVKKDYLIKFKNRLVIKVEQPQQN